MTKGSVYFSRDRLRRAFLVALVCTVSVNADPGSPSSSRKADCEVALTGTVATYFQLLKKAVANRWIDLADLRALSASNLNPFQKKVPSTETLPFSQGLNKIIPLFSTFEIDLALDGIQQLVNNQGEDSQLSSNSKDKTATIFAPKIFRKSEFDMPEIDNTKSGLFFYQDGSGDEWFTFALANAVHLLNINDPSKNHTIQIPKIHLMGRPRAITTAKGEQVLIYNGAYGVHVYNLTRHREISVPGPTSHLSNVTVIEDHSGRNFVDITFDSSDSRKIYEITDRLEEVFDYRLVNYGVEDPLRKSHLSVGSRGGLYLTVSIGRSGGLQVWDVLNRTKLEEWRGDGASISKLTSMVARDGSIVVAVAKERKKMQTFRTVMYRTGLTEGVPLNQADHVNGTYMQKLSESEAGEILYTASIPIDDRKGMLQVFKPFEKRAPVAQPTGWMNRIKSMFGEKGIAPVFEMATYIGSLSNSFWKSPAIFIHFDRQKLQEMEWRGDRFEVLNEAKIQMSNFNEEKIDIVPDQVNPGDLISIFGVDGRSFVWNSKQLVPLPTDGLVGRPRLVASKNGEVLLSFAQLTGEKISLQVYKLYSTVEESR